MARINIRKPKIENSNLDDCTRIMMVFQAKGFEITVDEAAELWKLVSEESSAGWLILDGYSDEDIFKVTAKFWSREDEWQNAPEDEDPDQERVQEY